MRRPEPDTHTPKSLSTASLALRAGLVGIASLAFAVCLALMGTPGTAAAQLLVVSAVAVGAVESIHGPRRRQQEGLVKAYVLVRSSRCR